MSDDGLGVDLLRTLDPASAVPRYRQIADQLAGLILDARPGARLPSEHEIVARLGVSRATATQALRDLEQRGAVYRRQGRGTFVADTDRAIRSNRPGNLPSFSEDLRAAGKSTRERVIDLREQPSPPEVASALGIAAGEPVWSLERVIVSDGEPVVHVLSWLPIATFPQLDAASIERSSLYEQLESVPGSPGRPCFADEHWSAASAPAGIATLLEVRSDVPVMRVTRTAYLHDQRPAEYVVSYVRGESFAVSMRIDAHAHGGRVLEQLSEHGG